MTIVAYAQKSQVFLALEIDEESPAHIPLLRWGKPEDHAYAALFLASEESSWMRGQVIVIDGGQSLAL